MCTSSECVSIEFMCELHSHSIRAHWSIAISDRSIGRAIQSIQRPDRDEAQIDVYGVARSRPYILDFRYYYTTHQKNEVHIKNAHCGDIRKYDQSRPDKQSHNVQSLYGATIIMSIIRVQCACSSNIRGLVRWYQTISNGSPLRIYKGQWGASCV